MILDKLNSVIKYPSLLKTIGRNISRTFVKDLLFVKGELGITPSTILDIGAAIGSWTKAAHFVFPQASKYLFEPLPTSFAICSDEFSKTPSITCHKLALSDVNGEALFYMNNFSFSSSLLKMTETHRSLFPLSRKESTISVTTKRLDAMMEISWVAPVMMKLDVQGAELLVLKGAADRLRDVGLIQIEVNFDVFYEDQAGVTPLLEFLADYGFRRFVQRGVLAVERRIAACDLLFLKEEFRSATGTVN